MRSGTIVMSGFGINGLDQSCVAKFAATIWGDIDFYGMIVKVTIVDLDEREANLVTSEILCRRKEYVVSTIHEYKFSCVLI